VTSIEGAEQLLSGHFNASVHDALAVSPAHGPVVPQIQDRVSHAIKDSPWVTIGRVRVNVFVLGADGRTPLYVGGRTIPPPPNPNPDSWVAEAVRLLPASADVVVAVPLDSVLAIAILVAYAAILVQGLFLYNRAVARREAERMAAAISARDATVSRAAGIQEELERVRGRLREVEPSERARAEEVQQLEKERAALGLKLSRLGEREAELRASASRATELEDERQALEELLEEAGEDLGQKEEEIQSLQDRLKRAARSAPSGGRGRAAEQLSRRMRTLYKNLEIDDRAIQDLVALRDETMKLKAEERIKRLLEDPDTASVRRKVGGLPPQLSIFELGFAGKGRIYYTRGEQTRYRILAVGAKNTQNTDMEYLSRLTFD
jgi:putative component of toxin-antitoxin plasmid stabilization module